MPLLFTNVKIVHHQTLIWYLSTIHWQLQFLSSFLFLIIQVLSLFARNSFFSISFSFSFYCFSELSFLFFDASFLFSSIPFLSQNILFKLHDLTLQPVLGQVLLESTLFCWKQDQRTQQLLSQHEGQYHFFSQ